MMAFNIIIGTNWKTFDSPSSYQPDKIMFDRNNNLWVTFVDRGIGWLKDSLWIIFNTSNSNLPYNTINCLELDSNGIWMGSYELILYNDFNFTPFITPLNKIIRSVSIDSSRNTWIGTNGAGAAKFNHNVWEILNTSNSSIPNNVIESITCDNKDNVLLGTLDGLTIYNPNGVATNIETNNLVISDYNLDQNYPNPFNPSTTIKYTIPSVGTPRAESVQLKVYDVLGNEVATLVNEYKPAGNYEVEFSVGQTFSLSSGVYYYQLKAGDFIATKKMLLLK